MYKIIDLDIDDSLSADTKVDAVALVEMPAIETNFVYFNTQNFQEKTFRVTNEISANACRARKFKQENPNNSCGTKVGWTRSSQLCDKKPITLTTVKRMYSYLSRHKIDLVTSKSYEGSCGLLMYDAWGGKEALTWSKRILQREKERFDYDPSALPDYVNYPTGDTKDNMLIEDIGFIEKIPYETKEDYIGRCIEWHIKNKGWDRDQAAAVCYKQAEEDFNCGCGEYKEMENPCWSGYEPIGTKELDGQTVPNCVPIENSAEDMNIDVFGYQTKNFQICPGAINTFNHLVSMEVDEDTKGMIRSAAQIADNVFGIEKKVLEEKTASKEQLEEANLLVDDFYDLIDEIDRIVGMEHNVDYMDGHIEVISSYLNSTEDFSDWSEEDLEIKNLVDHLFNTKEFDFGRITNQLLAGYTIDDIKRFNHKNPTKYYKYKRVVQQSAIDRDFCEQIEDRYFRRGQIYALEIYNNEFGHNGQAYSKWLYKGGPNCYHAWEEWSAIGNRIQNMGMVEGTPGVAPYEMIGRGYYPGTPRYEANLSSICTENCDITKEEKNKYKNAKFKSDEEQRMLYSPLMVPNILIPRLDDDGEKYFVRFTKKAIEKIQRKFMIEQRLRDTNLEHDNKISFNDMVMVESWLVNGKSDKAFTLGYTPNEIPEGTWMVGYKVLDTPEGNIIWNDFIKTGKVKGLSAEGAFLMNFQQIKTSEYLLDEIINILNQIN